MATRLLMAITPVDAGSFAQRGKPPQWSKRGARPNHGPIERSQRISCSSSFIRERSEARDLRLGRHQAALRRLIKPPRAALHAVKTARLARRDWRILTPKCVA